MKTKGAKGHHEIRQPFTPIRKRLALEISRDGLYHGRDHHHALRLGPRIYFSVLTNFSLLIVYLFIVFPGIILIALAELAITPLSQLFELLLIAAQVFTLLYDCPAGYSSA